MSNIIEIESFLDPALDIYARLTEAQLLNRFDPSRAMFIAESPKVIERALAAGYEPVSLLMERKDITGQAEHIITACKDVPVYTANVDTLAELTGFHLTRGVLCAMRRKVLPAVCDICKSAKRIAVLENIMNPTNVGAIFRSAAALGIDAVLLTPGCSDPLYRRSARVSMGTVFQVPWTFIGSDITQWPHPGIDQIKALGFRTAAMALSDNSVAIDDQQLNSEEKLAIILGSEGDGLTETTIAQCDYTVKIPMQHNVDSLNVAAASAVAFWQLCNHKEIS